MKSAGETKTGVLRYIVLFPDTSERGYLQACSESLSEVGLFLVSDASFLVLHYREYLPKADWRKESTAMA